MAVGVVVCKMCDSAVESVHLAALEKSKTKRVHISTAANQEA
jgi:hypothetical protein